MPIVETNWEDFLSPDSEIPHDVFFLVKGEGNDPDKRIGAHKVLLAGVSSMFRSKFYGPMKEDREVFEVADTTYETFNTMLKYIYKPPGSQFFPALHEDEEDEYDEDESFEEEDEFNPNAIDCPQKFFDLLNLAEYYQIPNLKTELKSKVLTRLSITEDKVILAATVAKKHQALLPFAEISTKMLTKCLKFLLQQNGKKARALVTQFWALVNNSEESLKGRLAGTPFPDLTLPFPSPIKYTLDQVGRTSYENCLYLACSGVNVR